MYDFEFTSKKSLYVQIKDQIKELIINGKLKAGDKLPSEREFCDKFDVSRITIRQAIKEAVKEGFLFTVQGKGTYVAEDFKISQNLDQYTNFRKTIHSKGMSAGTKILSSKIIPADISLCKILNIDVNNSILNLNLLGMANNKPYVLYQSYYILQLGQNLHEIAVQKEKAGEAFSTIDLYKEVEDIRLHFVEQTFEALAANEFLAKIMQIEERGPLFLISSILYDKNKEPLEYRKAYYRSDQYKFHITRWLNV